MPGYNWMEKYLTDDQPLADIIMPGSHDAGVFEDARANAGMLGTKNSAICQSGNLKAQFEAGSRFFDLRARLVREENSLGNVPNPPTKDIDYGRARFFHGGGKTGTKGGGVAEELELVKKFIEKTGEFCILRFTKTKSPNAVQNLVMTILDPVLYKVSGNLAKQKIGPMRGTVIAVFDGTFNLHDQKKGLHNYTKGDACKTGLGVCGEYSGSPFTKKVIRKQEDNLKSFIEVKTNLKGDRLYTWYQTQTYTPNIKSATAKGVGSKEEMLELKAKLQKPAYEAINIVMMDFVDNEKCRKVYRRNADQSGQQTFIQI